MHEGPGGERRSMHLGARDVTVPAVGVALEEVVLAEWLKQPGDRIEEGDPIVDVETDKATMPIESPISGVLGSHLFEPGDAVPVGATVTWVIPEGAAATAAITTIDTASLEYAREEPESPGGPDPAIDAPGPAGSERRPHRLSPRARRLAGEEEQRGHTKRRSTFRELTAAKVVESWQTVPHFSVTREFDGTNLRTAAVMARAHHSRVSITDLLVRALALGLYECGEKRPFGVGLAVATDRGVVNPVLPDVLALGLVEIAAVREATVGRARAGRLVPSDLGAAPTTLSNLGAFGVDQFTGIVTPGQLTVITVGALRPRVTADSEGRIAVRDTVFVTVNADHRELDGADAARLLGALEAAVSDIGRLLDNEKEV